MRRIPALIMTVLSISWLSACVDIEGPVFDSEWPFADTTGFLWDDTTGFIWDDTTGFVRTDFEWRGTIIRGSQVEIRGISGGISAHRTSGDEVVVTATTIGTARDLARVQIEVVTHAGGVTICAVYSDQPGQAPRNSCGPGQQGYPSVDNRRTRDARVEFTVLVPEGVSFNGQTVTGHIDATGLQSNAFVTTVLGDVRVSTTRLATATTVTGSIDASIGLADWDRDLDFTTVTGDIRVAVPANTNADVRASVASGTITSEFPLARTSPGAMRGVVGTGGRNLTLSAVAGDVRLKRVP